MSWLLWCPCLLICIVWCVRVQRLGAAVRDADPAHRVDSIPLHLRRGKCKQVWLLSPSQRVTPVLQLAKAFDAGNVQFIPRELKTEDIVLDERNAVTSLLLPACAHSPLRSVCSDRGAHV